MAVFSINSVVGSERLYPKILVYGTVPRTARVRPTEMQLEMVEMVQESIKEAQKEHAKRRLNFGLKNYVGPKGSYVSAKLLNLPVGAPVWVYRTTPKGWQGLFRFISIQRETDCINLRSGR